MKNKYIFIITSMLLLLMMTDVQAGLIVKNVTEDTNSVHVQWGWDKEESDNSNPTDTEWWTYLKMNSITNNAGDEEWEVHWEFQHKLGPHAGDVNPGAFFAMDMIITDFVGDDDFFIKTGSVGHQFNPGPNHKDSWKFEFNRSLVPANTTIDLWVFHIPTPATLILFGLSLAILGWSKRIRT